MSYLISQITLLQLQTMTPEQVKDSPSVVVTGENGNYLENFIVPQTDFIKTRAEHMSELSNGMKPRKDEAPAAEVSNEPKVKRVYKKHKHRKAAGKA